MARLTDFSEHKEDPVPALSHQGLDVYKVALDFTEYVEEILLNTMFDLPTRDDVTEVRVTEACITNGAPPLLEISGKRQKKEA